jgi:hypothetical protein
MAYIEPLKPPIPAGFQALEVASAAAVSLTIPSGSAYATIKAITSPIRYRDDGTDPTTAVGFSLAANDVFHLTSRKQLAAFKAIAVSATGGLEILYYKLTE